MTARTRRLTTTALLGTLVAVLTGCFTSTADYAENAETYIVDDDELESALLSDDDAVFVSATCADPENQDVGTTFTCTAVDSLDRAWEFEMTITESNKYEVNVARFPEG